MPLSATTAIAPTPGLPAAPGAKAEPKEAPQGQGLGQDAWRPSPRHRAESDAAAAMSAVGMVGAVLSLAALWRHPVALGMLWGAGLIASLTQGARWHRQLSGLIERWRA